jgi:hypothetical protein
MLNRLFLSALISFLFPVLAAAQNPELKLPSFAGLQSQARESVDVTVGWPTLRFVRWLLDDHDPDTAEMKTVLDGLRAVHVRSYQFDSDFVYSKADLDSVRAQLSGSGWIQLVQVRDRRKAEDVDIYVARDNHKVTGFAIIASNPREFTIVNIVGAIDLEHVAKLQNLLGLPDGQIAQVAQSAH